MPIYEYQCKDCGIVVEEFHGAHEKIQKKCESCGADLRRIFSPAGIVFKGSGFYITDYGKSSKRDHSSSSSKIESKSSSESKSSTETKPATESKKSTEATPPTTAKS